MRRLDCCNRKSTFYTSNLAEVRKNIPNSKLTSKDLVFRAYCSQPSSYPEYLGQRHTEWIQPEEILAHFSKTYPKLSYQSFVEQSEDLSFIQNIVLDI